MIKVDKGVSVPDSPGPGKHKWPWLQMEVGDSFFVKANGKKPCPVGAPPISLAKNGFRVIRRTVIEDGVRGYRIWRIE